MFHMNTFQHVEGKKKERKKEGKIKQGKKKGGKVLLPPKSLNEISDDVIFPISGAKKKMWREIRERKKKRKKKGRGDQLRFFRQQSVDPRGGGGGRGTGVLIGEGGYF